MTKIKICGVTRVEDAAAAAAAGADFLGLNFWSRSKRRVTPPQALDLAAAARAVRPVAIAGVFVDLGVDEVVSVAQMAELDVIQLHGDESPADAAAIARASGLPVWKAIAATPGIALAAWATDAILLDTPSPEKGGTGLTFDWSIAAGVRERHAGRIVLAGGLSPDNVAAAIAAVAPWGVDVASGVESAPGIKDPARIAAFVAAVRGTAP
jgi:phosphoribosylanthranilate isomerase